MTRSKISLCFKYNVSFQAKYLKHNTLIKYEIENNGFILTACTKNELSTLIEAVDFTLN